MVTFTVVAPSRSPPHASSGALLQQDNWNDFRFQTLYHLYVFTAEFSGLVGPVKVLRLGQTAADTIQLKLGDLPPLGDTFCSLGQSLDYYERLAELPDSLRSEILEHLQDALAYPTQVEKFFEEPGWTKSVLRDIDWDSFRRDASVLLGRDYNRVARLGLEIHFQVTGWTDLFHLQFSAPDDWRFFLPSDSTGNLPERVAVLTGRNGSGKSTLLARLARVLHASQRDRASTALRALGTIHPPGIGFTRVLNISYSAFDAFQVPGVDEKERRQIADDLRRGTGRYYFCGLRDISRELEEKLDEADAALSGTTSIFVDRQDRTLLKSIDQLAGEFERTIERIWKAGRHDLFNSVVQILASDPSLQDLGPNPASTISQASGELFARWSTGHKIVMHATASLVAFTEAKSIVLIDEPESHLHPPLLAAFMHALRLILNTNDAFAVLATHSPVVAQETLGRHVSVVRRSDLETTIGPPRIETYGESIGEITNEVFGLNSDATDFHKTLKGLVERGMTLDGIESLFERGLSLQARAYVMSELARRG
jgi:energy-coupling factor transporter ATP-binding protein EcfA2